MPWRPKARTLTRDDQFDDALDGLARLADSVGLPREQECLEFLAEARMRGDVEYVARELHELYGDEANQKLAADPAFPPPGWTGRRPSNVIDTAGRYRRPAEKPALPLDLAGLREPGLDGRPDESFPSGP